jgi:hypothetical protein
MASSLIQGEVEVQEEGHDMQLGVMISGPHNIAPKQKMP